MFEQLKEILVGKLQVPADLITMAATPEAIELDSLAVVELSLVLDKELGIKISDDTLAEAGTVGDIVRLMEEQGAAL
ncbi:MULTISPECIES: acyl carrier protein [Streptomyces]|uniref:Acyl carrier protein n=1 Tax=Streptomyces olivaceiscleroticus TaxID=68245 RepID=A0ABN0ZFB0_9ACTN|nr:phosphopantetheine-binding protein [Streptomyces niger]